MITFAGNGFRLPLDEGGRVSSLCGAASSVVLDESITLNVSVDSDELGVLVSFLVELVMVEGPLFNHFIIELCILGGGSLMSNAE